MKYFIIILLILITTPYKSKGNSSYNNINTTDSTLKILSWNVFMLPPFIYRTGKRIRAKAIGNYIKNSDYDVVVLQEMFLHASKRKLKRRIKNEYPFRIGPALRRIFSIRTSSGIYIASKYPMKKIGKTKFKQKEGVDNKMARKGALMVEINKNNQKYHVIGTHLNAGGSDVCKKSQVDQINDMILKNEQDSIPIFICGDFNINKLDSNLYNYTLNTLNAEDGELTGDWIYTIDSKNNDMCGGNQQKVIDFIFYKGNKIKYKSVERTIPKIEFQWSKEHKSLSDHQPVEILIKY